MLNKRLCKVMIIFLFFSFETTMHQQASRKLGFPILYRDGSRPEVLQSAGISSPKAVMVMYIERNRTIEAVQKLRLAFPAVMLSLASDTLK
jgi:voltage-gated potassium channel Kch